MRERTDVPPVETITLSFPVPQERVTEVLRAMLGLGFAPACDVSWREALRGSSALPGILLAAARCRKGLTQVQLAEKTGIARRHISQMESGCHIGRKRARLLGKALGIAPRLLTV